MNNVNKKSNILIVDDTPENLSVLRKMLTEQNYQVRPALNGEIALNATQADLPDLILLDIMMPEMDGYEVCRRLKEEAATRDIPVLFMSALTETSDKVKGFQAGGLDYITKPYHEEEVLARVRTHLTLRAQQLELEKQKESFRKLADASFVGILVHDQEQILEVNQTLPDMLGYQYGELIDAPLSTLVFLRSPDDANSCLDALGEEPCDLWARKQDGTMLFVQAQAKHIEWEGGPAHVVAVRDISLRTVLHQEQHSLDIAIGKEDCFGRLVGSSNPMKKVYQSIMRSAVMEVPVIIYGDTGTGKELAARTIFEKSNLYKASFVPVNCASIPENLFESLFFGHIKGAFTGAMSDQTGYFEQARGGTLFLDEIGELPLTVQAKLLRVLDDGTFTPVGASAVQEADVRLITATNRNLRDWVRQEKFRIDLFHRLHIMVVDLPSLKDRVEDIPLLIAHFLEKQDADGNPPALPAGILDRLCSYDWPGNVRELFNTLQRYLATDTLEFFSSVEEIPVQSQSTAGIADGLPLQEALERFEQEYITRTLKRCDGQKTKTAEQLGVNRKTLYKKLTRYKLDEKE